MNRYHLIRPFGAVAAAIASVIMVTLSAAGCGDDDGASGSTSSNASSSTSSSSSGSASTSSSSSSSGSASSSSSGGGEGGGAGGFQLSGVLSYEYVPYSKTDVGLDYAGVEQRPIRGVSVRLLNADDDAEIAKTTADEAGAYSFTYEGAAHVKLRVYAEIEQPSVIIEDNASGDALYVAETPSVDSGEAAKLDFVAKTGWGGQSYTGLRVAAPFAVLDAIHTAVKRFINETSQKTFPALLVNWSVDNRPEEGDTALGQIGTSHWDGTELYILGKEDIDTDEFDSHIILHEWGHYLDSKVLRSDTPGGTHAFGDVIDPRVAWSEGFATALAAMVLDPDVIYNDSSGQGQADGYSTSAEVNDLSPASHPGWYSEATVMSLAFDLYDDKNEPFDKVSIGLKGIMDAALVHKSTPAFTTLFSFIAAAKGAAGAPTAEIDQLVAYHVADADFGVDSVQNEWADGETHAGGVPASLPVYESASIGDTVTAGLIGGKASNQLEQSRFIRFVGGGAPVTVQSTSMFDVDLAVYEEGVKVASSGHVGGEESMTFPTTNGSLYIIVVSGFHDMPVSYTADIGITQ